MHARALAVYDQQCHRDVMSVTTRTVSVEPVVSWYPHSAVPRECGPLWFVSHTLVVLCGLAPRRSASLYSGTIKNPYRVHRRNPKRQRSCGVKLRLLRMIAVVEGGSYRQDHHRMTWS
jgi:ectoine hydroxylase-related dioxygenase (phytanoyl-CoA dioxygenase family)